MNWWRAEGNANDSSGTNNGTMQGTASFVAGEVGQAFSFDGSSGYVSVPDAPTLDSFTNAMTIECWIKSGKLTANPGWEGLVCKGNISWRLLGTTGAKTVYVAFNGASPTDLFGTRNVNDEQWHHIAATYDGNTMSLYVDGTLDASQAATGSILQTSDGLTIGNDAAQPGLLWNGLMDEVSLYNRALTSNEIAAIYNAGSFGKCVGTPPTITAEPTNQTVTVGGTAIFAVVATGTSPLSYQWSVNSTNIADATNASLTLANVQLNQAGGYSVVVSNAFGSTNSIAAVLTVNPLPSCDPPASGLVNWWRAEGDATDSIGTDNGTMQGTGSFVAGEVGQAFSFDGLTGYVSVPDAPPLDSFSSAMTIECWIKSGKLTANPGWEGLVCKGNASWRLQGTSGAKTVTFSVTGTTVSDLFGTRNVNDGQWHHVAGVYDGAKVYLYVDGTLDVSQASTGAITQTSDLLTIGNNLGQPGLLWNGLMDEVSLYNRALTSNEIAAIYNAGSFGKCVGTPPSITTEPTNETVTVGGTATFAVVATGTSPLSYQWSVNSTNIADATNASLTLANVQLNQAGSYSVLVSNAFGSTNSIAAVLTVNPLPSCDPPPSGLVNWWRAEGNANDSIGANNGTMQARGLCGRRSRPGVQL